MPARPLKMQRSCGHGAQRAAPLHETAGCGGLRRIFCGACYRRDGKFMASQTSPAQRIALVGMSGAGKTFWSKRLAANGRPAISCDDRIEERLGGQLAAAGHTGINGVAAWMGWPDSETYAQREADYLSAEIAALDEVLSELEQDPARELVLDTTGSVIYTGNNILMRLRRQMTVVYLAASAAGAGLADWAVFDGSQAGAVARGVSAEEWGDAARDRGAVLSEAGRGAAAELRGAGALHAGGGGFAYDGGSRVEWRWRRGVFGEDSVAACEEDRESERAVVRRVDLRRSDNFFGDAADIMPGRPEGTPLQSTGFCCENVASRRSSYLRIHFAEFVGMHRRSVCATWSRIE